MPHPSHVRLRKFLVASITLSLLSVAMMVGAGCDAMYYKTMKRFGMEKRDILVKRVREARTSQDEAKEEFKTALERFKAVVDVPGGKLEDKYETLNSQLARSEDKAKSVHDHIDDVRKVSKDLFKEWQAELGKYSDRALRSESERELGETKRRAELLIRSMERAEKKITPVLQPLRDRVLFLKHNLNARAIGALDRELVTVRGNVDALIVELDESIKEADAFIKDMNAEAEGK
jgi:Protein of unknown function (DUF2959)